MTCPCGFIEVQQNSSIMKLFTLSLMSLAFSWNAYSFCGFYVAKADSKLFNKSSQIIMVRNGNQTSITMANDYQGDSKDFAMVVPVPTVLAESDITTVEADIFTKLDKYSAPRMASYYDRCPCYKKRRRRKFRFKRMAMAKFHDGAGMGGSPQTREEALGIDIKAKYTVGEYDIVILSAKHSGGLEIYLNEKGYQIPDKAREVLEPYIKSDMKFFLVKVNLEKAEENKTTDLKPIKITFESDKFMLPIRLGMANADGDQDMIVYTFTKEGRTETTNYRTVKIPTNIDVPLDVKDKFGEFYKSTFEKKYKEENGKAVFLEYAWDVSQRNNVKCDPCVGPPPLLADLTKVGVDWLDASGMGQVFITRLHVRYNRENFPQDLKFQVTNNQQKFQGRYVIHYPATCSRMSCSAGKEYINDLRKRRYREVNNLVSLTGWEASAYDKYLNEYSRKTVPKRTTKKGEIAPIGINFDGDNPDNYSYFNLNYSKILLYLLIGSVFFYSLWLPYKKVAITR